MNIEIINTSKRMDDTIDYDTLLFRVRAANVLDLDNSDDMMIFLKTLILGGARKIIVDMEGLEFIDSSGIGILINSAKMVRKGGGDIVLLKVPERIDLVFKPVKLNRFINVFTSMGEALNFFRLV